MSDDDKEYIKHLEDALQRAQTRLESELMGKAVVNKVTTAERIGSLDPDKDSDILEGHIVVGGVIFAKIKKEKNGWAGYILEWNEKRNAYVHHKYVIGKKTFDDTAKKCISMMALDIETAMRVYTCVSGNGSIV
jgi:hypothetical protein